MYIRKRNPARDDDRLIDITLNNFRTSTAAVREKLRTADEVVVVCTENHEIAGYLSYQLVFPGTVYITYAVLDEQFQGQGIGRSLLPNLLEYARENGIRALTGYVSNQNMKSLNLFMKWGFVPIVAQANGYFIGRFLF
jgi:ribosomal protein S18 acetylase RimI-like enzyme